MSLNVRVNHPVTIPERRGFSYQHGGHHAGFRHRSEHFRAGPGTIVWVAYNSGKKGKGGGCGRTPFRLTRIFQMPGDNFGEFRMYVEGIWFINLRELSEIDPLINKKLPAGLVDKMRNEPNVYIESNWKQLLEFENLITDAEIVPIFKHDYDNFQPRMRMEVAECEPDHEGAWDGAWEECEVVAERGDNTCDVRILEDGELCHDVPRHFVRTKMEVRAPLYIVSYHICIDAVRVQCLCCARTYRLRSRLQSAIPTTGASGMARGRSASWWRSTATRATCASSRTASCAAACRATSCARRWRLHAATDRLASRCIFAAFTRSISCTR